MNHTILAALWCRILKPLYPLFALFGLATLACSGEKSTNGKPTDSNSLTSTTLGGTQGSATNTSGATTGATTHERFSFFVTSYDALVELSGSPFGFGGDLGGLAGADGICQAIAVDVGFGHKTWRAFLSATDDGTQNPVNAIDRIGEGPWYDASGRLIANNVAELTEGDRPRGDVGSDLPDEYGRSLRVLALGHDILTGSNSAGLLSSKDPESTCHDWTSAAPTVGNVAPGAPGPVLAGHAWPSPTSANWIAAHGVTGCAPGYQFTDSTTMSEDPSRCVGCSGGYGGIYCFALSD